MYLVRMIYVSTVANRTDSGAVQKILTSAQENNTKHDLTGLLVFNSKHYLQVIEGSRKAVNALLGKLFADDRHTDMLVMGMEQVHQRAFPDWAMEFLPADSASRQILLRSGPTSKFSPYEMTYESAQNFMLEMAAMRRS